MYAKSNELLEASAGLWHDIFGHIHQEIPTKYQIWNGLLAWTMGWYGMQGEISFSILAEVLQNLAWIRVGQSVAEQSWALSWSDWSCSSSVLYDYYLMILFWNVQLFLQITQFEWPGAGEWMLHHDLVGITTATPQVRKVAKQNTDGW